MVLYFININFWFIVIITFQQQRQRRPIKKISNKTKLKTKDIRRNCQ